VLFFSFSDFLRDRFWGDPRAMELSESSESSLELLLLLELQLQFEPQEQLEESESDELELLELSLSLEAFCPGVLVDALPDDFCFTGDGGGVRCNLQ